MLKKKILHNKFSKFGLVTKVLLIPGHERVKIMGKSFEHYPPDVEI